jgi:hypothetical protein
MRLRTHTREKKALNRIALNGLGLLAILLALLAAPATSSGSATAAPPAPCLGVAQIDDPTNDGHHSSTDVVSAWFSEDAGLQGVIKVKAATPAAEHDESESDIAVAGFVLLFEVGAETKYVRASIPFGAGAPVYDYGVYTGTGVFASAGATTGTIFTAAAGGSATIDIPAATGAVDETLLDDPFVLTYDGINAGVPAWVDHGPGGTSPTDAARGADYIVGSCGDDPDTTVAVQLQAPAKITGGGKQATVSGKVLPERAGVDVAITRTTAVGTKVFHVTSAAAGAFSLKIPVNETSKLSAVAEGISSQTRTITVHSTVKISVKKLKSGARRISGRVSPNLPGQLLLLRTTAFKAAQKTSKIRSGKFTFTLKASAKPGRFLVVYVPKGKRAERSNSNIVRVR